MAGYTDRQPPTVIYDRGYYQKQYRDYERQNPARKLNFYRSLVERAVGGMLRPRILDIGCAFGHFLAVLPAHWERCGIDASEYAIGRAARHVPGAQFAIAAGGEYPFNGPFDIITAFDVLEHIQALPDTLDWIAGNLRRDAAFVFVVPVYDGPTGPVIRFLDRDPTHCHKRSRSFWLHEADARFRPVDWWGIFRYLMPGGYYLHAVTHRLRGFCPAIACIMRRL